MTESRFMFRRIARVAVARFVSLGADESGVALAVTILMFSLLFLSFASVYAIGTATREKIHLQNAADAAAYSAAVVQADTLSRLATINRAMAWTYVQQTRRKMDYIVYQWLDLTLQKYDKDYDEARDWHNQSIAIPPACTLHHDRDQVGMDTYTIGKDLIYPTIDLNGDFEMVPLVRASLPGFLIHLTGQTRSATIPMVGTAGLAAQMLEDSAAIVAMNLAEDDLVMRMKGRMKAAAESTLDANIPNDWKKNTFFSYHHDEGLAGMLPTPSYLRLARNNKDDERQFCGGVYSDREYPNSLFEAGIDKWFVRAEGHGNPASGDESGIKRAYVRHGSSALHSSWSWYSIMWICYWTTTGFPPVPVEVHIPIPNWGDGEVFGDDPEHSHYETAKAMPWFVDLDYFSSDGTVSVGVARRMDEGENVWSRITGTAQGLFAAFTPSVRWTWAFSSAKAGYHRPSDSDRDSRAYDISWRGDSQGHGFETVGGERKYWNLCETDWDAVFLPVRKAKTMANASVWTIGSTGFMQNWVTGTWTPLGGGSVGSEMANVSAPPEVGLGRSKLDWGRITDVMYH